jgi:hypothetical protein
VIICSGEGGCINNCLTKDIIVIKVSIHQNYAVA